jgi:hypothetical protein
MKKKFQIAMVATLLLGCFACKTNNYCPGDDSPIPVIGHSFKVDYGDYAFRLDFKSETELTYTSLKGSTSGVSETVKIIRREIRPNVYWVCWQEKDKTTVSHVEDFSKGLLFSSVTWPDKTFANLRGALTLIK